jgi:hypothetical protein
LGLALVGLASVAVPLAGVWALLGLWLGRQQGTMLSERTSKAATAATRPITSSAG